MNISEVIINNFRSFGPKNTRVNMKDLSVLIGANSSGKTASIQALLKIFSPHTVERIVERSDFHVPANENLLDYTESSLSIEAIIEFNELETGHKSSSKTIPPHFNHMVASEVNGTPYVRIRLDANLVEGNTPDGDIEQELNYIISPIGTPKEEENKQKVKASERSQIQMIYIPANRDPARELKNASGTILGRILKGINWPKKMDKEIQEQMLEVDKIFDAVEGVKQLRGVLNNQWNKFHNDFRYGEASVAFNHSDLNSILKKVEVFFEPTETGEKYTIDQLGDGLRSIFYLSLVNSFLDIESKALMEDTDEDNKTYNLLPPTLTLVAVEEPENHISPHLLGRIMERLKDISTNHNAQVIVATHSPSMIKRIDPESIFHFRINKSEINTIVKPVVLPDKKKEEEYKFIKAAVMAYPEIYFSQLVVLGEGDSEEIIIPKIIELLDTTLDQSNISVVPLGGRHVNHFWRLLNQLNIPYITLLDLDLERSGGGWGRIKYVIEQLLERGYTKEELLTTNQGLLSDEKFANMHNCKMYDVEDKKVIDTWISNLIEYDVVFSYPLDIDFMMLEQFLDSYREIIPSNGGPKGIKNGEDSPEYKERLENGIRATLKSEGGEGNTYTEEQKKLMIWYDYFFLGRGKPSTHIMALENIDQKMLEKNIPNSLNTLLKRIQIHLKG